MNNGVIGVRRGSRVKDGVIRLKDTDGLIGVKKV